MAGQPGAVRIRAPEVFLPTLLAAVTEVLVEGIRVILAPEGPEKVVLEADDHAPIGAKCQCAHYANMPAQHFGLPVKIGRIP